MITFCARFAFGAVTWVLYLLFIWLPLVLLGALVVVPLGYFALKLTPSTVTDDKRLVYNPSWRWVWLWSNQEDGWLPVWYSVTNPTWSRFRLVWTWAAVRNAVDSLRFVPWLSPPQVGSLVKWETHGSCTLVWQSWRSRVIWVGATYQYWLGWKYYPESKDAEGWSRYGCGFTVKRIKNAEA